MKYLLLRGALNKNSLVLDELAKKQQIRSNILKRKNSKLEATFLREKNSLNNLGSQFKFWSKHIGIIPTFGLGLLFTYFLN